MYLRCFLSLIAVVFVCATKKRFDGNILISVVPTEEEHYRFLSNLEERNEIDIWNEIVRNGSVHVMFEETKKSWLLPLFQKRNMNPTLLIQNVQKLFDDEERQRRLQGRFYYLRSILDDFYDYDQYTAWLKEMVATYPNLATLQSIGKTAENRDIWLIKLTSKTARSKKLALFDFGIHAREWISPATGAYFINELLTTYSSGGSAKTILDTWELHIVPILNPDGYAYTFTTNRMWRKNRKRDISGCYGVDLNRNFGYKWNTGGSSDDPCSDTYHGGSPMSENEAQALQRYATGTEWTTYLTFHSYGQWWFTNWGYTANLPDDYTQLAAKAAVGANAIQSINGRKYTIGSSAALLYVASGGSEDWTRGTLNVKYSYCIELPPTGSPGFNVPTSEIRKTGYETYVGLVAYLQTF